MWGQIASAAIGAGSSLLGGMFNRKSTKEANEANAALQREFAQNGIQWKVEDARKAGVHPIYALGAQTMSAAPSYVGDTSMGSAIAEAGQNISRAVHAGTSVEQRVNTRLTQLALERGELENDLLRSQIARNTQVSQPAVPMGNDPFVMAGQANSGVVSPQAVAARVGQAWRGFSESAAVPSVGWEVDDRGTFYPVPSEELKNRIEDSPYEIEHWLRNRVGPFFRYHEPFRQQVLDGKRWWNPASGGYELIRR